MPKCVMVLVPPVQAPNVVIAALVALFPLTVQPEPERATAILAYPVYVASLVVCEPVSPGSAVCRLMKKDPAVVDPRRPVASPMLAAFALANTRLRIAVSKALVALKA
jgi:hypothetical protein